LRMDGNNDEGVRDWSVEAIAQATPAAAVPDVPALMFFAAGLAALLAGYTMLRMRDRKQLAN